MYTAELYNSDKRKNSTKIPSGGTSVDVTLKGGSAILSPTFTLSTSNSNFNMIKWNGRFYWVTDYIWERNNLLTVRCSVDPLSTWKEDILATNAYVNYASTGYDVWITDPRLGSVTKTTYQTSETSIGPNFSENGTYILGVVGNRGGGVVGAGFTTVYAMEAGDIAELADFFTSDGSGMEQLTMQLGDAWGCLAFCKWIPYTIKGFYLNQIKLGSVNTGVFGQLLSRRIQNGMFLLEIPWPSNDFRRFEPFTSMELYLPFVGVVSIALSDIADVITMSVAWDLDMFTGEIIYTLVTSHGYHALFKGNCSIDIPLTTYQRNMVGTADNLAQGIFGAMEGVAGAGSAAASGAAAGGAVGAAVGAGMGAANTLMGVAKTAYAAGRSYMTQTAGIKGGFSGACGAAVGLNAIMIMKHNAVTDSPGSGAGIMGRPVMATRKIESFQGYVECGNFSMGGNATLAEKAMVESFMLGGVYIE